MGCIKWWISVNFCNRESRVTWHLWLTAQLMQWRVNFVATIHKNFAGSLSQCYLVYTCAFDLQFVTQSLSATWYMHSITCRIFVGFARAWVEIYDSNTATYHLHMYSIACSHFFHPFNIICACNGPTWSQFSLPESGWASLGISRASRVSYQLPESLMANKAK